MSTVNKDFTQALIPDCESIAEKTRRPRHEFLKAADRIMGILSDLTPPAQLKVLRMVKEMVYETDDDDNGLNW